jgi:hypothetical protein
MKNNKEYLIVLTAIMVLLLAACGGTAEPVVEEAPPAAGEAALKVGDTQYSMADLEGMESLVVEYTKKDGSAEEYTGVPVMDVLADAGLKGDTVVFTASDGYEAELAVSELESCPDCVVAFDGDQLRLVLPGFPGDVHVRSLIEIYAK